MYILRRPSDRPNSVLRSVCCAQLSDGGLPLGLVGAIVFTAAALVTLGAGVSLNAHDAQLL